MRKPSFLVPFTFSVILCDSAMSVSSTYEFWKLLPPRLLRFKSDTERVSSSFTNEREISPEAKMTTAEIIANRGYPVEVHSVTTDDGYILELHRIPRGKGQSADASVKRRAVYLQHGIFNTDIVWIIQPTEKALAFILADLGYEVWLGNSRGNTYSRKHVSLNPEEQPYWEFSFDEMGKYDIPAAIEYVLSKTGRNSLSYIGHSLGCGIFFIAMTHKPELNSKIDVMIALAPATSQANSRTSARLIAPFINQIVALQKVLGTTVYQPVNSLENNFRKRFCGPNLFLSNTVCKNYVFSLVSDDYRNVDPTLLPVINGHHPGGTSLRAAALMAQNYKAGQTFQPYDFGPSENIKRSGQPKPPPYDLSKATSPVYIFWGENDKASTPEDVAWLASKLGNLRSSIKVDDPLWNHGAFIYSRDAKRLVYDRIATLLPSPII